jgi:hypothetical protein
MEPLRPVLALLLFEAVMRSTSWMVRISPTAPARLPEVSGV